MKALYIWLPQGRLGNLIFQYQAVAALSGDAPVLAIDSDFFDLFEKGSRFSVLPIPGRFRWRAERAWLRFFQMLAERRIIGLVEPETIEGDHVTNESATIRRTPGMLSKVFAVRGFFQTPRYMNPLPRLKPAALQTAERRLSHIPRPDRVAVHMRFGDYVHWPVFGVPGLACLPDRYYLDAIAFIKARHPSARFVVLSDEPARATAILEPTGERFEVVEGGTALTDFALISACSHVLVSASTYSWWAATLVSNPDRLLVAPEYWLGFRRKTWFPPDIRSAHFHYLDPVT